MCAASYTVLASVFQPAHRAVLQSGAHSLPKKCPAASLPNTATVHKIVQVSLKWHATTPAIKVVWQQHIKLKSSQILLTVPIEVIA